MPEQHNRYCLVLSPRQREVLELVSQAAGVSQSEAARRMIDHCSLPPVLDALFPHLSGHVRVQ